MRQRKSWDWRSRSFDGSNQLLQRSSSALRSLYFRCRHPLCHSDQNRNRPHMPNHKIFSLSNRQVRAIRTRSILNQMETSTRKSELGATKTAGTLVLIPKSRAHSKTDRLRRHSFSSTSSSLQHCKTDFSDFKTNSRST